MKSSNPQAAWQIFTERKARPTHNRTAFIAALIIERCQPDAGYTGFPIRIESHMAATLAAELVRLANAIHHLCEAACNYQLSQMQEKRLENLQTRFTRLADALGFEAITGGDPRGACAFLINPDDLQEGDGWGTGWAVFS